MFRHYNSGQGRFMSADLLGGSIDMPQSGNRYAYVLNDPINSVDLWGLCTGFIGRDKDGNPIFGERPCHKAQDGDDSDGVGGSSGGAGDGGGGTGGCGGPCPGGGGDGGGPGTDKKKKKDNQQLCDSIQQNYDRTANETNAKWDVRFWASVVAGAATGNGIGALAGAGLALVYDESRSDYNKITQDASQQWQAAGCPGNLKSAF
jgi:hypothetical protein